ncbi:hypothetical protein [Streptomyces sp. F001]|uniref:hypothetical protein n=1 Tax=Streptomyces sp. F001 TaxID=1510026 RepID=UPI0019D0AA1B|nr:hypothetical protein [Streptomyces sp. F001]
MTLAIGKGNQALEAVDLAGDPQLALARLVEASWHLVDQARALLVAAQKELPPGRIRELHSGPAARVETLIAHGRAEGVFRTDLPLPWLVNALHSVMHSADEIRSGNLAPDRAAAYITATVLAAFTRRAGRSPSPARRRDTHALPQERSAKRRWGT